MGRGLCLPRREHGYVLFWQTDLPSLNFCPLLFILLFLLQLLLIISILLECFAQIFDFISNELPEKFDTLIGERGSRISGGQKQRIGIARALYHNPSFIVFDEATSSLDNITEKIISDTVFKTLKSETIVMVAHRISTIKNCDIIYVINKGKVEAKGSYDLLLNTKDLFREIVQGKEKNKIL